MEVRCVPCGSTGGAATRMVYRRIRESNIYGIPFSPENRMLPQTIHVWPIFTRMISGVTVGHIFQSPSECLDSDWTFTELDMS